MRGLLFSAVALAASRRPALAGCEAVGCARVDWTELSDVQADGPAAIDLHGVFATRAPVLAWGAVPMTGHLVARCADEATASCRMALDRLFDAVAAGEPLVYEAESNDFPGDGLSPGFITPEGEQPEVLAQPNLWPEPSPGAAGGALCRAVFDQALNPAPCPGDCDGSSDVGVDEVLRGVKMALGLEVKGCPGIDASGDGLITVDEVVTALGYALEGCPPRD